MISGSFSLSKDPLSSPIAISRTPDQDDYVFQHLTIDGFSGGYYLNGRLPYSQGDFFFYDEAGDLMILLSGSVYNKVEIISSISGLTEQVTDPELIARLFLRDGPDFVSSLNGDFAIFILRPARRESYLYRDHVGIRPVAYSITGNTLSFSTDITGLCRSLAHELPIDTDYLTGHFRYIDYRTMPCEEVKKLLPGYYLCFSEEGIELKKYWEPEKIRIDRKLSHDRMLADLRILLHDAVRIRSDNRFIAGAHVSSGIDSGIVSVLARKEYRDQEPFYGFSWSPADYNHADINYDERLLVRKLCDEKGITPLFSDLGRDNFPDVISSFPQNDGFFSEERTLRQAADAGVNVIFSGWGGDEFISTGAPAIEADLLRDLKFCLYLRRNEIEKPKKFIKNLVNYVLMPAMGIHYKGTARSFRNDARYLKKPFRKSDRMALRRFYFNTSRRRHHLGMLDFYHLQDRCERWYVMGYHYGVEYRYPLLDRRIIEYMLRIPSELLCKTDYSRPLLREISFDLLPDEIRLNMSKNDPVYWKFMDELKKDAALKFAEEVDQWKDNADLHFIDFKLLAQDIQMYKKGSPVVADKVLFRALVYIKGIHEFTEWYHTTERI